MMIRGIKWVVVVLRIRRSTARSEGRCSHYRNLVIIVITSIILPIATSGTRTNHGTLVALRSLFDFFLKHGQASSNGRTLNGHRGCRDCGALFLDCGEKTTVVVLLMDYVMLFLRSMRGNCEMNFDVIL